MPNSRLNRYKLDKIIKHFCVDIEASKTAELTEINRNTINRHYSIFRHLIFENRVDELKQLTGEVEMDESYFGPSRVKGYHGKLKRGRGTLKQPVFGIFERKGQVYTEIIPDCSRPTLRKVIIGKVDPESIIHTDKWRGYDGLVDVGYDKYFRVNHRQSEFSKGNHVHINGIESFWSFTKRRLSKFNGVKVNFNLHLKECEWRWNKTADKMMHDLKKQINGSKLV